jgi:hypothetical protein
MHHLAPYTQQKGYNYISNKNPYSIIDLLYALMLISTVLVSIILMLFSITIGGVIGSTCRWGFAGSCGGFRFCVLRALIALWVGLGG